MEGQKPPRLSIITSETFGVIYSFSIYEIIRFWIVLGTYADLTFYLCLEVYDLFELLLCIIFGFCLCFLLWEQQPCSYSRVHTILFVHHTINSRYILPVIVGCWTPQKKCTHHARGRLLRSKEVLQGRHYRITFPLIFPFEKKTGNRRKGGKSS